MSVEESLPIPVEETFKISSIVMCNLMEAVDHSESCLL